MIHRWVAAYLAAALAACGSAARHGDVLSVRPQDVKWEAAPGMPQGAVTCTQSGDPEKGPYQALLRLPKGTKVAPHYHRFDEAATVLSGRIAIGQGEEFDESKAVEVGPGGYLLIPAGRAHWAIVREEATLARYGDGPREKTDVKLGEKAPSSTSATIVPAGDVKWIDAPDLAPGAGRLVQYGDPAKGRHLVRLKFPAGTYRPPHRHSADECVTVLSGTLMTGQGEQAEPTHERAVEAGGYVLVPRGAPHWVRAKTDVVFHLWINGPRDITYVNPADDPARKK